MSGYLFTPYPLSLFSKIERIRELTRDSEIVDFNPKLQQTNHGNFCSSNSDNFEGEAEAEAGDEIDNFDMDVDNEMADNANNAKQTEGEVNITDFLETNIFNLKLINEQSVISYKPSSIPSMNVIKNFLKGVVMESQKNQDELIKMSDRIRIQELSDSLLSTLSSRKEFIELLADDLKEFAALFPLSGFNIVLTLLKDMDMQELMFDVLRVIEADLTDDQYNTILTVWLQKHSIDSNNLRLPESILTKNPKFYEDVIMMELLASSLARSLSDQRNSCSKFSKFLLQVVTKVASTCDQSVFQSLSTTVENNKTFLKKRMEAELRKKCSLVD